MDENIYNMVLKEFEKTKSIKEIAAKLGTSIVKVRRILITENLWESKTSSNIVKLHRAGKTVKEISEILNMSQKNVQAYLPYTKGTYNNENKTLIATRCDEFRKRIKRVIENQADGIHKENMEMRREEYMTSHERINPLAMRLKIELITDIYDAEDELILKKYAKMNDGFTRDIIVPGDMTLHALHYVIQKLFGWQNSHLHCFSLPDNVFDRITDGMVKEWMSLCGVYFRFPDSDDEDRYWDDDYNERISFNTWLKGKYKGPYHYSGKGDYYYSNQIQVQRLKTEMPRFEVSESFAEYFKRKNAGKAKRNISKITTLTSATIEELQNSISFESGMNELLERLFITDYLILPGGNDSTVNLKDKLKNLEDELNKRIPEWNYVSENIPKTYDRFCDMVEESTIRNHPVSDELIYSYDYGDNWKVRITCTDCYFGDYKEKESEFCEKIEKVIETHSPICIASDGMNLMDDVGGISGYCNFLRTIHESKDENERIETREWGRYMGWTGRISKPDKKL